MAKSGKLDNWIGCRANERKMMNIALISLFFSGERWTCHIISKFSCVCALDTNICSSFSHQIFKWLNCFNCNQIKIVQTQIKRFSTWTTANKMSIPTNASGNNNKNKKIWKIIHDKPQKKKWAKKIAQNKHVNTV